MVDSRAKGRTAELKCRDELRKLTGLRWERTPMSGALSAHHKLKGDLYVPETPLKYCVEVKHYKDNHVDVRLLTNLKPKFQEWWDQTVREAEQMDKEPLLVFKYDRSKWFAAFTAEAPYFSICDSGAKYLVWGPQEIMICLLTDFCECEDFV